MAKFRVVETLTFSGGSDNIGAITMNMAVLATDNNEIASYTNLYDKYKICSYKVTFVPRLDAFTGYAGNTDATQNLILWTCLDYDDGEAPASVREVMNYRNARWTRGAATHSRYIKYPHILGTVQSTAAAVGASVSRAPWRDCKTLNINHFGFKYACKPGGAAANKTVFDVVITAYVKFAGRR